MKVKTRLALYFTAIVMVVLVLFSATVYLISEKYRRDKFHERLENRALTYSRLLVDVKEVDSLLLDIIDQNTFNEFPGEKIVIFNDSTNVIYENDKKNHFEFSKIEYEAVKAIGKSYTRNGDVERVGIRYFTKGRNYIVFISASDENGHADLNNLRNIMLFGLSVSLVIVFLAGLFYSSRVLTPIKQMADKMDGITAKKLSNRLQEGNRKDEISRLAITFNSMLNRLEAAFELQSSFLSGASHELRTPLTAITGQVEVALMKDRSEIYYKELLDSIHSDLLELNRLLNSILEMAHSGMDIAVLHFEEIHIDELLLNVRTMINQRMSKDVAGISFGELPEDEEKLLVYANENLLKIAFFNLCENAVKFSDSGTVNIFIYFVKKTIIVEIVDSGAGIDAESLPHVFEPFYRSPGAKRHAGHGLGLSLVKKITDLHHGEIEIHSVLSQGTTVRITLPIASNF